MKSSGTIAKLGLFLVFAASVWAQAVSQIQGTVQDSTGAAVPGAEVKATNTQTHVSATVMTKDDGSYEFLSLQTGNYEVTVTKTGFRSATAHNITLTLNQIYALPIALEVGQITESVQVDANPTQVETTSTQLNYSLNSSLSWAGKRNNFGISYYRGANNGSGVLAGSIGQMVSGSLTRLTSRTFSSGITGGYSRNNGVVLIGTTTPTLFNQTFDYWYGSGSISHPVGRSLGLTLSYTVQYQVPHTASCVGAGCGASTLTNLVSFGVGWHERPLLF